MIQIAYISDTKSIDIFVISAMLFSVMSVIFNLFYAISRQMKQRYKFASKQRLYYESKKVYKLKIECSKLESYHRYTHKLLQKLLCSVLGIDNSGNIEVFYIVPVRNGIIAHVQVLITKFDQHKTKTTRTANSTGANTDKAELFTRFEQVGKEGGELQEALKQELNNALKFDFVRQSVMNTIATEPGQNGNLIGDKIKIRITTENDSFANTFTNIASDAESYEFCSVMSASGSNEESHLQAYTSGGPISAPSTAAGPVMRKQVMQGVPMVQGIQGIQAPQQTNGSEMNQDQDQMQRMQQMQQIKLQMEMLQAQMQYLEAQQSQKGNDGDEGEQHGQTDVSGGGEGNA